MRLSYELVRDWHVYCAATCGEILPINSTYVTDDEAVRIGYEVPDGSPAVRMTNGRAVRQIMIEYHVEDIELDDIN